ncbi:SulP family inorganic anion transporter [Brachybacterium sp. J153]|uniref:SulP family inorganic anion transporter n=1 Tax=Brachybacterium sp. J153 TaxID=3116488 RepID=UPI003FA58C46
MSIGPSCQRPRDGAWDHVPVTRSPVLPDAPAHSQASPPSMLSALRSPRLLRIELLSGLVVALAMIPEVVSFSVLAGVDPRVGLFTAVIMAITIAIVGGRPAMVSAAAGATALVIAPLVASHGMDHLIAAVLLAGVLQIVLALLGVARLMRFIPRSVMTGFVNALAILIFTAQLPHLFGGDVPWVVLPLLALALALLIVVPRLITVIPAPLITIAVLTVLVVVTGWQVPDVADQGEMPESLPALMIPDVPLTLETLRIIAPYAVGMALVGLMESLLTAKLVDDLTDTHSDKTREAWGQGVANLAAGAFGGMGGCAMIGQTMINVKDGGGRTRLSTLSAGVFLLVLVMLLSDVVGRVPMVALAAVMIMVCVATVDWHSVRPATLRRMPVSETLVMVVTVVATVATHNLAVGVIAGVLTAIVAFARRVAHLVSIEAVWESDLDGDGTVDVRRYLVHGQLFFASSNDLVYRFDYAGDPEVVIVDLTGADVWDASSVAALDAVRGKYAERGKEARIVGLEGESARRMELLSGHLGS